MLPKFLRPLIYAVSTSIVSLTIITICALVWGSYPALPAWPQMADAVKAKSLAQADDPIIGLGFRAEGILIAGQEVRFVAEIQGGTNVQFRWDFGDGTPTASGQEVVHIYAERGTYNVTLIADNSGSIKTATQQIDIRKQALSPPVITITGEKKVGNVLMFDASVETDANIQITWDFGDGEDPPRSGNPVFHSYDFAGTFLVTAEAVNLQDPTDRSSATELITVADDPILGFAQVPQVVTGSELIATNAIRFRAVVNSGTDVRYRWNFGDGSASVTTTEYEVTHVYSAPGIYKVTVNAFNSISNIDNTIDNPLFVEIQPLLEPLGELEAFCILNQNLERTITCAALVQQGNPATFSWNFNDGTVEMGAIVQHTFEKDGKYNVRAIASNEHPTQNFDSHMQIITIATGDFQGLSEPVVAISPTPTIGAVTWFTLSNSIDSVDKYVWRFGDGSQALVAEGNSNLVAFHTYEDAGLYVVTIDATSADGNVIKSMDVPILVSDVTLVPIFVGSIR